MWDKEGGLGGGIARELGVGQPGKLVLCMLFSGKQIVGYVVKPDNTWEVIGTRSPQDPQVRRQCVCDLSPMYTCISIGLLPCSTSSDYRPF